MDPNMQHEMDMMTEQQELYQMQQNALHEMQQESQQHMNEHMHMPPMHMGPPGGLPPPGFAPPGTGNWPPGEDFMTPGDPGVRDHEKQLPSLLSLKVDPPEQLLESNSSEVVLPQALEQVLALKNQRAVELGTEDQDLSDSPEGNQMQDGNDSDENDENVDGRQTSGKRDQKAKNKRKKKRKKNRKQKQDEANAVTTNGVVGSGSVNAEGEEKEGEDSEAAKDKNKETGEEEVEVEYVQESIGIHELAPQYRQFFHIFQNFKIQDPKPANLAPPVLALPTSLSSKAPIPTVGDQFMGDEAEETDERKIEDKSKMSKRKLKKLTRLSVAELKQLVNRPDVVEMHDVTARDPKLLVQLKAHRNTVQVPRHWCFKRKYLQGKRGIEKPPFNLPDFIKRTGIMEMRASLQDKDESKTLKAKMRERARPKLGKIDIDYQKLHDAFFKWQTKPKMTIHGDLYYEGKEFETRLKEKKPGDLSEELRTALGMPVGPGANKVPPPWLIAMQRYGPPPSYPNLKIPGLNAPIPENCSFGYHAGGWGKPPVDENGKPLYGDVFGTATSNADDIGDDAAVDRSLWGELESESEEESEEEQEEEEEGVEGAVDETGLVTPAEGLVTPSGLSSIPAGMETPETIELRKKKIEAEMEGSETPVLYHVLAEKRNDRIGNSMMGSSHVYDMTGVGAPPPAVIAARRGVTQSQPEKEGMVELALDPSELDMDSDAMAVRYEQQMRENQSQLQKEDLSDMLAEHVARQKNKRRRQQNLDTKQTKKYKEFKF